MHCKIIMFMIAVSVIIGCGNNDSGPSGSGQTCLDGVSDGTYHGQTSQGETIEFTVTDKKITSISFADTIYRCTFFPECYISSRIMSQVDLTSNPIEIDAEDCSFSFGDCSFQECSAPMPVISDDFCTRINGSFDGTQATGTIHSQQTFPRSAFSNLPCIIDSGELTWTVNLMPIP